MKKILALVAVGCIALGGLVAQEAVSEPQAVEAEKLDVTKAFTETLKNPYPEHHKIGGSRVKVFVDYHPNAGEDVSGKKTAIMRIFYFSKDSTYDAQFAAGEQETTIQYIMTDYLKKFGLSWSDIAQIKADNYKSKEKDEITKKRLHEYFKEYTIDIPTSFFPY